MTLSFPKALDATSPAMLTCSVFLHGLILILIVSWSFLTPSPQRIPEAGVNRIKLVAPGFVERPLEKVQRGPVKTNAVEADPVFQEPLAPEESREFNHEKVELQLANSHPSEAIAVKKRARSAQRVDAPQKKSKVNSEVEAPKKSAVAEDPLEKRLASIRKEVQDRKSKSSGTASAQAADSSGSSESNGLKTNGDQAQDNLARWFEAVRTRINSHWSLFGDTRRVNRLTVVGVKLDDDGKLADASVDESSGDPVFDRSAVRAVFQAAPFPPLPMEVKERIRTSGGLALRFTPGGIQ